MINLLLLFSANMQDSFLNSQSEDSEREKKLQEYLSHASSAKKKELQNHKAALSDILESFSNNSKDSPVSASFRL